MWYGTAIDFASSTLALKITGKQRTVRTIENTAYYYAGSGLAGAQFIFNMVLVNKYTLVIWSFSNYLPMQLIIETNYKNELDIDIMNTYCKMQLLSQGFVLVHDIL